MQSIDFLNTPHLKRLLWKVRKMFQKLIFFLGTNPTRYARDTPVKGETRELRERCTEARNELYVTQREDQVNCS